MAFVTTITPQAANESPACPANGSTNAVICKSPHKLQSLLISLKTADHVHYVSDGDWSTHDLIVSLLDKYKPANLFITTYAIREFSVRQLVLALQRGDIASINMLVDYRAKVRTPEVYQLAAHNSAQIALTSIHAKVVVLQSLHGSVTIVGSSNLTSNPRIEAGVITRSSDVAAFHISWIQKTLQNADIFS